MTSIRCVALAITFVLCGRLSTTADAQLLVERLVPPQQFAVPPLPASEQPIERLPMGADKVPRHLWSLPQGVVPGTLTVLTQERARSEWKRPVLDVPLLASAPDPARPAIPRQPESRTAFVTSDDLLKTHVLDRFALPGEPALRVSDDATSGVVHTFLTLPVAVAIPQFAPLLRLGVVDPFEHYRVIRLDRLPDDTDPSDRTREIPQRPQLSVPK